MKVLERPRLRDFLRDQKRHLKLALQILIYCIVKGFGKRDRNTRLDYLTAAKLPRKLHLGCGKHPLQGWLNSDLFPSQRHIIHLDVRYRFPFKEKQFDYIFSEHLIEHLPYAYGIFMLEECCRVLKPGGVLRLSTPNLRSLLEICDDVTTEFEAGYVEWATARFSGILPGCEKIFWINNYFRDWGHQFIYEHAALCASLKHAGFDNIRLASLGESDDDELRGLENVSRMPKEYLQLESLILEATKAR